MRRKLHIHADRVKRRQGDGQSGTQADTPTGRQTDLLKNASCTHPDMKEPCSYRQRTASFKNSPRAWPARISIFYASNNTDCSCNHQDSSLHPSPCSPSRCCNSNYHDSCCHCNSPTRLLHPGILYFLRVGRCNRPICLQLRCFSRRHGRVSYRRLRAVSHRSRFCQ